jgi:hypothetical protein
MSGVRVPPRPPWSERCVIARLALGHLGIRFRRASIARRPRFQRAVRLTSKRLGVRPVFPVDLAPVVWGTETTMTAESFPFRRADRHDEGDPAVFTWSTSEPPPTRPLPPGIALPGSAGEPGQDLSSSETMRRLGIVQEGEPILREVARPFDLPAEAEDARRVVLRCGRP